MRLGLTDNSQLLPVRPLLPRHRMMPAGRAYSILRMGDLAHAMLTPIGRGRVLASTSRVLYLTCENQELLWMSSIPGVLHRRGLEVDGPLPDVSAGSEWVSRGPCLHFSGLATFDRSDALVWQPVPARAEAVLPPDRLAGYLGSALPVLARLPSPAGFGVLIPAILSHLRDPFSPPAILWASPSAMRAWPAIQALLDSCLTGGFPSAWGGAEGLIGLGEGLTPSGDDFLGGFLYLVSRVQEYLGGCEQFDSDVVAEWMRRARPRTNEISYVLLADHAGGHACETLQDVVDALLVGQDAQVVESRAVRLTRLGHSTGWDLLTGVVAGAVAACCVGGPGRPAPVGAGRWLKD